LEEAVDLSSDRLLINEWSMEPQDVFYFPTYDDVTYGLRKRYTPYFLKIIFSRGIPHDGFKFFLQIETFTTVGTIVSTGIKL
jgi:hypothetical protein